MWSYSGYAVLECFAGGWRCFLMGLVLTGFGVEGNGYGKGL